jgi:hypothetical protein
VSAPATASIIRVPGVLIWNPTSLSGSAPYGGTYLGTTRGISFKSNPRYRPLWDETSGSVLDLIYAGEGPCELKAIVRYPDSDMLTTAAEKAVQTTAGGVAFLFRPQGTTANTRAGRLMSAGAGVLLFAPHAATAHPMVLIYNAIPMLDEDLELRFSQKEEWGLGVSFMGTPDASGRVYAHGRKATLTTVYP